MTVREPTRQQLDPAGTLGMRMLTRLLCAASFGYAVVMAVRTAPDNGSPLFAVTALAVLGLACLAVLWFSSPDRAPFTRGRHLVVHLVMLSAIAVSAAGEWGNNRYIRDDWWPVSFGLLLIAVSHYRPARELAAFGTASGVCVAIVVWLQADVWMTDAPPVSFIVLAVTPMLGMCYAAAAYGSTMVGALQRWRASLGFTSASLVDRFREGISRSVQQDRVTILSRDVLPFFTRLIAQDRIEDADRVQARSIAASIRAVMVAEADRSWLESVVHTVALGTDSALEPTAPVQVTDHAGVAPKMTADQRTILRALIVAVFENTVFDSRSLRIVLEPATDASVAHGVLTVRSVGSPRALRSLIAPFLAVMRITFDEVGADIARPTTTIKFSYVFE